jgi:hypothetical protein
MVKQTASGLERENGFVPATHLLAMRPFQQAKVCQGRWKDVTGTI